jgi:imidazole glycerol-phosphate synthase subunit HisF
VLKKRIMGVVTVKSGWAVQSFGYQDYLPLGKPEVVVKNLDNWGVDEIFVQVIDRSKNELGPDLELLQTLSTLDLSTPLIYGGGIASVADAVEVVRTCAERISVDATSFKAGGVIEDMAAKLGGQAIVASVPVRRNTHGAYKFYSYLDGSFHDRRPELEALVKSRALSELIVIDADHEGYPDAFDVSVMEILRDFRLPLIAFGGLCEGELIGKVLSMPNVSAIGIGNFLNYREHAVQKVKRSLGSAPVRPAFFYSSRDWSI